MAGPRADGDDCRGVEGGDAHSKRAILSVPHRDVEEELVGGRSIRKLAV